MGLKATVQARLRSSSHGKLWVLLRAEVNNLSTCYSKYLDGS